MIETDLECMLVVTLPKVHYSHTWSYLPHKPCNHRRR